MLPIFKISIQKLHIIKISIILALANGLCQELVKMLAPIMDKVVILARVSTDKQEYQRQVNELTDYCSRVGWSVEAVFSNKVSGAKRMEEKMKFSLSFIENMGSCVATAPIHLKLNILGPIFSGKIVFENEAP